MSIFKKIYFSSCSVLPMHFLKGIASSSSFFPYHHTVSSERLPHISNLYNYKDEAQFSADLDFLLKNFSPMSVGDVTTALANGSPLPPNSFLFTFDDGFRELHDVIAPILEKKSVPAIFFINPAFIDNKLLFYRCKISLLIEEIRKNKDKISYMNIFYEILGLENKKPEIVISTLKNVTQNTAQVLDKLAAQTDYSFDSYLKDKQPFLREDQLVSLRQRGFSIGGHSMDHPYYNLLSMEEQLAQTVDSCKFAEEKGRTAGASFSFPHSDADLSQALMTKLNDTEIPYFFGIQNQKNERSNNIIHRFNAERPGISMEKQLKGLIVMMKIRKLLGNDIVRRK